LTASRRAIERSAAAGIVLLGFAARVWSVSAGLPHAVGIDEPAVVDRALRILTTGSWNVHAFDYPSLVIYLHAMVAIVRFMAGAVRGEWRSLQDYDITAVFIAGRIVTAAIGTATVWLVYDIGRRLHSPALGLVAALELAVLSLHVRESHFVLTDVPVTALAALTILLTIRARTGHAAAHFVGGAAGGLTAAAKYNGVVVIVSPLVMWALDEWRGRESMRRGAAILVGALLAFVLASPFVVLDLPSFLNGFAAQMGRFAVRRDYGEPVGVIYLKHLQLQGALWTVSAVAGALMAILRPTLRRSWAPLLTFTALYFYVLSTHTPVFARYALPITPPLCLLSALAVVVFAGVARRVVHSPWIHRLALAGATAAIVFAPAAQTVKWIDSLRDRDTRAIAADWLLARVPPGARIVVENSGPTYLARDGLDVITVERVFDRPVARYRELGTNYFVISGEDRDRYSEYVAAGSVVFELLPGASRKGPPIRIVMLK
jgi:4-amino-4-deoxy-L-arabinose transferase-like glycosyltransferase